MQLTFSTPSTARLSQLLVLLMLALGLLAGVSVSQSRAVEAQAVHTAAVAVPALQAVHDLAGQVDEQRGMAALLITLRSDAERQALEARLQASRNQLEQRMAAFGQRLVDDTHRQHHATVLAGLADFWAAQDKLVAASRHAASDPVAAQAARALLVGESRVAFERVRADIQAWWAETQRAAAQAADQARAAAEHAALVVWALALIAAMALAAAWALLRRQQQRPLRPTPPAQPLDSAAAHQHLLALNQAVANARRGQPGRAAGLSALEAQRLAEQVDTAAQALRRLIDRPAAAAPAPADQPGSAALPH